MMNYDPIHDTYAQGSEMNDSSNVENHAPMGIPHVSGSGAGSGAGAPSNHGNLPVSTYQGPVSSANPALRDPVYQEIPHPVQSGIVQATAKLPDPPNSTPACAPLSSDTVHTDAGVGDSIMKEHEDKLSINNLLGHGNRGMNQPPTVEQNAESTFHEDDDDDEDDDDEEDDEEEDDGDEEREAAQIQPQEKIPEQLPADFRSISKGFKHLKKADGEPFWRKDIQYDFLDELFKDENRVFTNYFPSCSIPNAVNGPKLTFSELYIRTLAESSKASRVLRERLIKDKEMGISVSKVCLLVNAGRMNTTVNFVPDMRSALRTYHSIPSLQANPDGQSRPLQDTPRLKTILKAVCEGQGHLQTLLDLLRCPTPEKPNTNVIKLIFLMSTFFQNIPFHHDEFLGKETISEQLRFVKATSGPQNKFMEFFLGDNIYPKNRARRFLWLLYTYLETSFTVEELENNPFNPKVIPPVEYIPKEDLTLFDNDKDFEVEYAAKMYDTRMMHLDGEVNNMNPKRGNKSKIERQRIRKQLTSDHHYRPAVEKKQEDMADDSSIGDETIQPEDNEVTFNETAEDSGRAAYFQKFVSGSKRKKPTPSVGALVDFSRKDAVVDMKWANPVFPIKNLDLIRHRYSPCTRTFRVPALTKECDTSVYRKRSAIQKSQHIVELVSNKNPEFEQVRKNVLKTLDQQFAKQCARGNGLLAMEWDSIRSDISNGIEAYLYQQFGKSIATHINDKNRAEEQLFFRNPDSIRKESFMSGTEKLLGDSSPIDIGTINKYGADFTPIEKFNSAGERTNFEFALISKLLGEQQAKLEKHASKRRRITFNLSADGMSYK